MSIHDYLDRVQRVTRAFPTCSTEQALCYAVESVVASVLPVQRLTFAEAVDLVEDIALDEDIDVPHVERLRANASSEGVASHTKHAIGLKAQTDRLTVCHEMAHILAGFGHDDLWRDAYVALVRRYVSVQHASLLHTLYLRSGLPVSDWRA